MWICQYIDIYVNFQKCQFDFDVEDVDVDMDVIL